MSPPWARRSRRTGPPREPPAHPRDRRRPVLQPGVDPRVGVIRRNRWRGRHRGRRLRQGLRGRVPERRVRPRVATQERRRRSSCNARRQHAGGGGVPHLLHPAARNWGLRPVRRDSVGCRAGRNQVVRARELPVRWRGWQGWGAGVERPGRWGHPWARPCPPPAPGLRGGAPRVESEGRYDPPLAELPGVGVSS